MTGPISDFGFLLVVAASSCRIGIIMQDTGYQGGILTSLLCLVIGLVYFTARFLGWSA